MYLRAVKTGAFKPRFSLSYFKELLTRVYLQIPTTVVKLYPHMS